MTVILQVTKKIDVRESHCISKSHTSFVSAIIIMGYVDLLKKRPYARVHIISNVTKHIIL